MTKDQKKFLLHVSIGMIVIVTLSLIASSVHEASSRRSADQRERSAHVLLDGTRSALTATGDVGARILRAASLSTQAEAFLMQTVPQRDATQPFTSLLARILPLGSSVQQPSSTLAARVRTLRTQLDWLGSALPVLTQMSGYDVVSDIRAAQGDPHELFVRMYGARRGLSQTVEVLAAAPVSLSDVDVQTALVSARGAYDLTTPLIRMYDNGTTTAAAPLLEQFVSATKKTSEDVAVLITRLTSDRFLQDLASASQ